jgi:endonuclease-3
MSAAKRSRPAAAKKTVTTRKPAPKAAAKPPARPAAGKPAKPAAAVKRPDPAARRGGAARRPQPPAPPAPPPAPPEPKQPPRPQVIAKLFKALRANYKPIPTNTSRPLLDQVLYACCLENAPADAAEKALQKLVESAYDLNEIRVTTVAELAESLPGLPDPARAALALRRVLQSVFESTYTYSLDNAKKHSLAHGLKTLEHLHGATPFVVNHVASTALGGHFIPLDQGALTVLYLCGAITKQEYDTGKVTGLERIVAKKSGQEFASLLHQFGVECLTNLHGATVKKILTTVNPLAKDRFPKRGEPLPAPLPPPPPTGKEAQKAAEAARQQAESLRPAGPQAAARPAGKTPLPPAGSGPKKPGDGKPGPKPFVVKPNVGKPLTIKPELARPPAPPAAAKPTAPAKRPPPAKPPVKSAAHKPSNIRPRGAIAAKKADSAGKSHARQLAKRKPR